MAFRSGRPDDGSIWIYDIVDFNLSGPCHHSPHSDWVPFLSRSQIPTKLEQYPTPLTLIRPFQATIQNLSTLCVDRYSKWPSNPAYLNYSLIPVISVRYHRSIDALQRLMECPRTRSPFQHTLTMLMPPAVEPVNVSCTARVCVVDQLKDVSRPSTRNVLPQRIVDAI